MPKTIPKYRGYTPTVMKTRADIPEQVYMTVSGNNLLVSDVSMSKIRQVLNTTYTNLSSLAKHANVNVWSAYGPTVRTVTGSGWDVYLTNSAPTSGFTMGSFAGYNHDATTPGWAPNGKNAAQADVWVDQGTKATVISDIHIGELLYENADGLVLVAFDGSNNIKAYGVESLSTLTDAANLSAESIDNINSNQTWTLKSYLKVGTINSALDVDDAIMYRVPNVDNATVNIKVKLPTTYPTTVPSPWYIVGSVGLNLSTGYYSLNGIAAAVDQPNITITARLYNWTGALVGSGVLFDGNYTAYNQINNSVYLGMAPIPNYGYTVNVDFESPY